MSTILDSKEMNEYLDDAAAERFSSCPHLPVIVGYNDYLQRGQCLQLGSLLNYPDLSLGTRMLDRRFSSDASPKESPLGMRGYVTKTISALNAAHAQRALFCRRLIGTFYYNPRFISGLFCGYWKQDF